LRKFLGAKALTERGSSVVLEIPLHYIESALYVPKKRKGAGAWEPFQEQQTGETRTRLLRKLPALELSYKEVAI
jgi:hypothetical protein